MKYQLPGLFADGLHEARMTMSERCNGMSAPEVQNTLTTRRDKIAAGGLRRHEWQLAINLQHNGSFPRAWIL